MKKLRYGIIGIGNMGSSHATALVGGKVPNAELTAICDTRPARIEWAKENLPDSVALFDDDDKFWNEAQIDAVVIATPHYDHPTMAQTAFDRGIHVLVEKPAGVYTMAVRQMNEAAKKSGKVFGIMYNQRTNPVYQKIRDLVQSGELGELKRVIWIITNWYRSQSYYNSSSWRATWEGEGGGVLLNQCPHQLDMWQWICGMPSRIRAFMYEGRNRDVEVETDVTAYAEYPNGATGLFVTATHETPGTNRLEIAGDRGKLVVENDKLTFWRNRVGETQFNKEYAGGFGNPECWKCEIPVVGENPQHVGILQNFASAVLEGTPLLAPGEEGIRGLSISNAMHLSAWTGEWVSPEAIDEQKFYDLLQERIKNSTFKKTVNEATLSVKGTH